MLLPLKALDSVHRSLCIYCIPGHQSVHGTMLTNRAARTNCFSGPKCFSRTIECRIVDCITCKVLKFGCGCSQLSFIIKDALRTG